MAYVPPEYDLYEAWEPGSEPAQEWHRWFVATHGRVDLPAAMVTLGYHSTSLSVLVSTGSRSHFVPEGQPKNYSLRFMAMLGLIEFSRSSPRFDSPPGRQTMEIIEQYAAEPVLWEPAVAVIDSTHVDGQVAHWQAGWALVIEQEDVCIAAVGVDPVPGQLQLRKVTSWQEYDVDLGRAQSREALSAVPSPFPTGRGLP